MRLRKDRKQFRQKEAVERQQSYDKLTPQQKISLLDKYSFVAKKQRAKLNKLINKG